MKFLSLSILLLAIHYSGARQRRSQNQRPVLSLQNIISAGNKERAMQMMELKKAEVQAGVNMPKLAPNRPCQQKIVEMTPNLVPNLGQNLVPKLTPNLPCQKEPEVIRVPVPYPVPVQEPGPSFTNPFLPVASPVSAWAPSNGLLPPVIPSQSRSHFLRKIVIPPPTL